MGEVLVDGVGGEGVRRSPPGRDCFQNPFTQIAGSEADGL